MKELIEAIENYKQLVELNLNAQGCTLEHSVITKNLNEEIKKAKEKLNNKNLTVHVSINAPEDMNISGVAEEVAKKITENFNKSSYR